MYLGAYAKVVVGDKNTLDTIIKSCNSCDYTSEDKLHIYCPKCGDKLVKDVRSTPLDVMEFIESIDINDVTEKNVYFLFYGDSNDEYDEVFYIINDDESTGDDMDTTDTYEITQEFMNIKMERFKEIYNKYLKDKLKRFSVEFKFGFVNTINGGIS